MSAVSPETRRSCVIHRRLGSCANAPRTQKSTRRTSGSRRLRPISDRNAEKVRLGSEVLHGRSYRGPGKQGFSARTSTRIVGLRRHPGLRRGKLPISLDRVFLHRGCPRLWEFAAAVGAWHAGERNAPRADGSVPNAPSPAAIPSGRARNSWSFPLKTRGATGRRPGVSFQSAESGFGAAEVTERSIVV